MFSAFAQAANAGAVSERHVVAVETGQLGDPQPGLGRQQQQCTISAAFPSIGVGCVDERVALSRREKGDELFVESFGRDRQDPLDHLGVLGVA